jgi:hypothetical protein
MSDFIRDFAIAYLGVAGAVAIIAAVLADQFSTGRPSPVGSRIGLCALAGLLWPLAAIGVAQMLVVVAAVRRRRGRSTAGTHRHDSAPAVLPAALGPIHRGAR